MLKNKKNSFLKQPTTFDTVSIHFLKCSCLIAIIGVCTGTASAFFLWSLDKVTAFREAHTLVIIFLPIAGLAIGLLYFYKGKNIEAGNNLVIGTINDPKEIIPFRMAPFILISTLITHLFGGSAGREGTAIQMSGAIADQLNWPLKLNKDDRKILMIASVAAGFGSIFGTPWAAGIFALEVAIAGKIKYKALAPSFAAAFLADLVTRLWTIKHTVYHIDIVPAISVLNILYTACAGIVFGICAYIFTKGMHHTSAFFKTIIKYPPLRPLVGGILIIAAVYFMGTTKYIGLGIPTIIQAFGQQLPAYDFLLKIIFTIVTLSAGFKGGEVTPLFFIGAVLGNALFVFIPLPMALLAGMGFVAVFAGATKTPIACAIMGIELFGYHCGIYVAIACIAAYLFSGSKSIYHAQVAGGKLSRYYSFKIKEDLQNL